MGWMVDSRQMQEIFHFSKKFQTRNAAQISLLFIGYWGLSLGVKRPGHEDDHSSSSGAKAKNERNYNSSPLKCLLGEHRDKFIFVFDLSVATFCH
jgi:hypothetical protein